jgi:competence protein ComEA
VRLQAGTTLLVLVLLAGLGLTWGQSLHLRAQAPPAPTPVGPARYVLLGAGFPASGIHQFSDGQTLLGVINMTELSPVPLPAVALCLNSLLQSGSGFDLVIKDAEIIDVIEYPMPAGQRLALGVPLHPDRMGLGDWEVLPGIGPALARRIELDRQENGEFGSLERLERVRGIGPKRIQAWSEFF